MAVPSSILKEDRAGRGALATAVALATVSLLLGLAAFAAVALLPVPAGAECQDDLPKVGYLGITDLNCDCTTNFSMRVVDGQRKLTRVWTFRSEPVVKGVRSTGPSAGKMKEGDVITAVDGALITTREGSRRFSTLEPGQDVTFTVRRDDRDIPVTVTVGGICPEALKGVFSPGELVAPRVPVPVTPPPSATVPAPGTPLVDVAPPQAREVTPPAPPARASVPRRATRWTFGTPRGEEPVFRPEALPKGWLGVGLSCQDCGGELPDDARTPVWSFGTLPTISFVDPEGPSARAGLRRGDQLTHIDGISLISNEGGRRFGAVKPGQTVRWRVIRDGTPRVIAVTAVQRPGEQPDLREQLRALRDDRALTPRALQDLTKKLERIAPDARRNQQQLERASKRLRYAGSVGDAAVEVRGLGNVVVDDSGDEVVIITRDATIRIKPNGKIETTPRSRER